MIAPEVLSGLAAVSRVSRALVGTDELPVLAAAALEEMREALQLRNAALYLPDADGAPVLRRYVGEDVAEELSFSEEAWRLAVSSGSPIVLREAASWLVENPFTPPAANWMILPLVTGEREMVGAVIASSAETIRIDSFSGTVLSLLGLQLSAGITTARLRRELLVAAMERERRQLAAEVHDGLAQDDRRARRDGQLPCLRAEGELLGDVLADVAAQHRRTVGVREVERGIVQAQRLAHLLQRGRRQDRQLVGADQRPRHAGDRGEPAQDLRGDHGAILRPCE